MRQRVAGAIGISCGPLVLIADEPTTSLDVTIQAQYLRLLRDLQEETGCAIIFITHDFGIVATMCDRVAVMYAGKIVEQGDVRQIFNNPSHPYTEALINAVPKIEVRRTGSTRSRASLRRCGTFLRDAASLPGVRTSIRGARRSILRLSTLATVRRRPAG